VAFVNTPLRYPGGKSGLTNFIRLVLAKNGLRGGHYIEPYCGGAGAAVALLRAEAVSHIHLNDIDPAVFAFWRTLVRNPEILCNFVESVALTVSQWRHQREIYLDPSSKQEQRACAFLYLNRVNRSGILNGGLIGGLAQKGTWLMDARFNRADISNRIRKISEYRDGISVHNEDALKFIKNNNRRWPKSALIYLDPPYYLKGQCLYRNAYEHNDHARIASYLRSLTKRCWIASYDANPEIASLYAGLDQQRYCLDYTARNRTIGKEVIIYGAGTIRPRVLNPMKVSKSDVFPRAA
jgi:DNA adenine methylase